jgi:hypothetical protein
VTLGDRDGVEVGARDGSTVAVDVELHAVRARIRNPASTNFTGLIMTLFSPDYTSHLIVYFLYSLVSAQSVPANPLTVYIEGVLRGKGDKELITDYGQTSFTNGFITLDCHPRHAGAIP